MESDVKDILVGIGTAWMVIIQIFWLIVLMWIVKIVWCLL
jgi:hypothetical protein